MTQSIHTGTTDTPKDRIPESRWINFRLWMMRFIALFVVPALFLGVGELALRVSGYGYPTSYFLPSSIGGGSYLIPNYKFSYRFFPPALARVPALSRIPAEKPASVYRIFVFGESAALGDPDPNYGVSRYLEVLLEEHYPDSNFEVICVAMTAINSHVILPMARESAHLEGDLWVIYMGNNEMVGPFGAGTIFGARAPALGFIRASLSLKTTKLGQLMADIMSRLDSAPAIPDKWTGINMFKENLLRHDDPSRLRAYENFEGNLKEIIKVGQKAGVPIILSTVGSNLKDCSPFASLHRENLDESSEAEWNELFQKGIALEKSGKFREALSQYTDALAIDSEYAELLFRLGTCQLALGQTEPARRAFAQARDFDALAVRADSRINQIVIEAFHQKKGKVVGIDAAEILAAQSPEGIPGEELFYEHVHFNTEGNYGLARIIADQVGELLPALSAGSQNEVWLKQDDCNRKLALTVWDQLRLWSEASERIDTAPFLSQTSNRANMEFIENRVKHIRARVMRNTLEEDRKTYENALEQSPEDTLLIGNFAQFLDGNGMSAEAIEQAKTFRDLLPDIAWTHYYLGALLAKDGRFEEAEANVEKALQIRGDFVQAQKMLKSIQRQQR